jgi:hypothetical protein
MMNKKTLLAPLCQSTQNRATIIGIQGNCQMEKRGMKLQEYWNIGVMGKWAGESTSVTGGQCGGKGSGMHRKADSRYALCVAY